MALVTAEAPTGFVVVQFKVCVQLLAPDKMVQVEAGGVRVPDMAGAAEQVLPFQLVPAAQFVVTVASARF